MSCYYVLNDSFSITIMYTISKVCFVHSRVPSSMESCSRAFVTGTYSQTLRACCFLNSPSCRHHVSCCRLLKCGCSDVGSSFSECIQDKSYTSKPALLKMRADRTLQRKHVVKISNVKLQPHRCLTHDNSPSPTSPQCF